MSVEDAIERTAAFLRAGKKRPLETQAVYCMGPGEPCPAGYEPISLEVVFSAEVSIVWVEWELWLDSFIRARASQLAVEAADRA